MDEKRIEKNLEIIREELPVNKELKAMLRKKFVGEKKTSWIKRVSLTAAALAAVACLFAVSLLVTPEKVIERANAASLKIANHLSFVEIGGGSPLGVSEHEGMIYIPIAGKGLFAYDKNGFRQIINNKEINSVSVSPDGKKLAFSALGTIHITDLDNNSTKELIKGGKGNTYFEEPAWSRDGLSIVFTKMTMTPQQPHGLNEKDELYTVNLETMEQQKVCDGYNASFLNGTDALIFERNQKIVYRNLKDNTEKVMDNGRFPSVSPDGTYVAYVKTEKNKRNAAPKAEVMETIDNVWIADALDFKTKKRITSNFPDPFTDEKEWLNNLNPSGVTQVLNISGRYSYYDPVWSSDSDSIYLLKNLNQETDGMKLARIDFTTQKASPEDTVKRFLQALLVRDEDFAKSIMKNPPDILTISNPRQVGFKILGKGREGEKEYVNVEVNSAYTASPYFTSSKVRFYLSTGPNGYIIDDFKSISSITVSGKDDKGEVYIERDGIEQVLFRDSDIPAEFGTKGKHRFASMAFHEDTNTLVFTVQLLQEGNQKASVKLISYNLKTKTFKLLEHITSIKGQVNIGVENIVIDSKGEYAALDLFSDDDAAYKSYTYLYNLRDGKKSMLGDLFSSSSIDQMHTLYWDEGKLMFSINSFDQNMKYIYNPAQQIVSNY